MKLNINRFWFVLPGLIIALSTMSVSCRWVFDKNQLWGKKNTSTPLPSQTFFFENLQTFEKSSYNFGL